jgi:hypothetical protein
MSYRLLASALASVLFFSASSARADDPAAGFRIGGGLMGGLMLNADPGGARGALNPQQLGFHGLMGYSFPGGFYIGGSMKLFLGQKADAVLPGMDDITFMTQQFALDLGYAIGISEALSVRPMLELALNRYGLNPGTGVESDVGLMMNPGVDLIGDVSEHFWLGGGIRFAFALMGDEMDDIRVNDGSIDVSLQFSVDAGLRF